MLIAAKLALGFASTIVFAGVYTFREGVIRVDVDEHHSGGSHVHFWVPAAAVPMAMHFVPKRHFRKLPPEAICGNAAWAQNALPLAPRQPEPRNEHENRHRSEERRVGK